MSISSILEWSVKHPGASAEPARLVLVRHQPEASGEFADDERDDELLSRRALALAGTTLSLPELLKKLKKTQHFYRSCQFWLYHDGQGRSRHLLA